MAKEPLYPHVPKGKSQKSQVDEIINMLMKSVSEEVTAYVTYERRAERIKMMGGSPEVIKVFQHVMSEELEHKREFEEMAQRLRS